MTATENKIAQIDWLTAEKNLNQKGFCLIPEILSDNDCSELISGYCNQTIYRKTVVMERHRFGLGEYKYFNYPLPDLLQKIRETVYPKLVPIANKWMKVLKSETVFPESHHELLEQCQSQNQAKSTVLILKYGKGGFNTLHQDLYGDVYFPFQLVLFLNRPEIDFTGGEFVLTEQIPRSQSKAMVLTPQKGDMLILTTNFRPVKSGKGYYRVSMKHGVSEIYIGERHTAGIIFHDAVS